MDAGQEGEVRAVTVGSSAAEVTVEAAVKVTALVVGTIPGQLEGG